jgi:hypothetical protein
MSLKLKKYLKEKLSIKPVNFYAYFGEILNHGMVFDFSNVRYTQMLRNAVIETAPLHLK